MRARIESHLSIASGITTRLQSMWPVRKVMGLCVIAIYLGCVGCGSRVALTGPLVIESFVATPAAISPGQNSTLTWSVSLAAVKLTINDGSGNLVPSTLKSTDSNSLVVSPTSPVTTYTMTATDSSGNTATAYATVSIYPVPVINNLSISSAIIASGQPVTISWSVSNAAAVAIECTSNPCAGFIGGGEGSQQTIDKSGNGSVTISPSVSSTYTFYANSIAGLNDKGQPVQTPGTFVFKTVSVTVVPTPTIVNFTALPPIIGPRIPCSTLAWDVAGVSTDIHIDNGIGPISSSGGIQVCPTTTMTYTLTATNTVSGFPAIATQQAVITLSPTPPPYISSFVAAPPSIGGGGNSVLSWSVAGADTLTIECVAPTLCDFNGAPVNSPLPVTGSSVTVNPAVSTTYELKAKNSYGSSAPARVRVIAGQMNLIAGSPNGNSGFANTPASPTLFNGLNGITADNFGNLYVADTNNNLIRQITPGGVVTTFAGTAGAPGSPGVAGSQDSSNPLTAKFNGPRGVVYDPTTGNLYVADAGNSTIRMISQGVVTTIAGLPPAPGIVNQGLQNTDPQGDQVLFYSPTSIAVDSAGNLYVADNTNCDIRKIANPTTIDITVITLAGSPDTFCEYQGGQGPLAHFNYPSGVAVDTNGNVFVADTLDNMIRKITPDGTATIYAGSPTQKRGHSDGTGSAAGFNGPTGVAVDAQGVVYVADNANNTIRRLTPTPDGSQGISETIVGAYGAPFNYPLSSAPLPSVIPQPYQVTVDPTSGNLFFTTIDEVVSAPY